MTSSHKVGLVHLKGCTAPVGFLPPLVFVGTGSWPLGCGPVTHISRTHPSGFLAGRDKTTIFSRGTASSPTGSVGLNHPGFEYCLACMTCDLSLDGMRTHPNLGFLAMLCNVASSTVVPTDECFLGTLDSGCRQLLFNAGLKACLLFL